MAFQRTKQDETRTIHTMITYNDYKLATYLLFSLHDKPNPFFIEKFETNLLPLMDSENASTFINIFSKIGDASKNNKTISQTLQITYLMRAFFLTPFGIKS